MFIRRRMIMYLKRLESVGFKSFAERIRVDFVPGVTAIVGPNGSGKSNIIDAIRWVLGEQSAKSLRGAKMEDIIFQGSDTRKPLNFAEVTLILDNMDKQLPLDYEEVSVTRRVYRSGESEFYINKQACRLKDIVDLFLDSGLAREAFSIISQGKVEEILSSKAEERRTIFEEAAGVLKYKQRKRKAQFKLEETEENLNRVEDIIYEIEKQINPLKKQADKAKTYKQLKETLKQKEISLLVTEIEDLHQSWEQLLKELEQSRLSEIELKTNIQKRNAAIEDERHKLEIEEKAIEALQTELLHTTQQLEQMEGKKNVLHEQRKHFTENKKKLIEQQKELKLRIEETNKELDSEVEKQEHYKHIKQKTEEEVDRLKKILLTEEQDLQEQIEELKADYIEYLNEQAVKRNDLHSLENEKKQIQINMSLQEEKINNIHLSIEKKTNEKSKIAKEIKIVEKEMNNKKEYLSDKKNRLVKRRDTYQQSQKKLYEGTEQIAKLKSRKEMLEEMKDEFHGFFYGVKEVLQAKQDKKLSGIYGAVIELIQVPDQYITAIDTVLGGQAQHIVVENDRIARDAIQWLKKEKKGRATFLPIASIKKRFLPINIRNNIKEHEGFVGIASDLVTSKYQDVVEHLMGHIIVTKTLKDANEIAKLTDRKYRIVTLEGDVVHPGGSMTGGAQKRTNQSLFARDKEIKMLDKKLISFEKRKKQFELEVEKEKESIDLLEQEIENEEQFLSKLQIDLQQLQTTYQELEIKIASLNDQLSVYDLELQQLKRNINKIDEGKRHKAEELVKIDEKINKTQEEIDRLMELEDSFKVDQEKIEMEYQEKRIALAEQEERLKNQLEKTSSLKKRLVELKKQYDIYENEYNELLALNKFEKSEDEWNQLINEKQQEKDGQLKQIQQKREQQTNRNDRINDHEHELKALTKELDRLLEKNRQAEVQANRLDVALENRLSHLQTEYEISYEKASQTYEKTNDPKQSEEDVQQLKQSIEHLGTVNLGAIEEYERVSERYAFLTGQQQDLLEAKKTLFTVIEEMDAEMKQRFSSSFTKIKREFTEVFQELFGGGYAELTLTDPDDLLSTGVEIVARPPGKKLQSLALLSGGERALTAIALLFAILRVRPVPFCILDEVEAALDEANVVRFANYVKLYSDNTQFIVITHRKGTMEGADVLYGVTMQESGVSRLVSVRLEDTDELVNAN
mgnify:CR=1 FL=1